MRETQYQEAVQIEENPEKLYRIMGIATPEYELYSDYEDVEVPGQCGAYEATQRLQELLAPGTPIWLEVDETGFYTQTQLDRQVWVQLDGRYRLVAEILVSEGHAVVATQRPGMAVFCGITKLIRKRPPENGTFAILGGNDDPAPEYPMPG